MLWFAPGSASCRKPFSSATIALEISSRNARVAALQKTLGPPARRPGLIWQKRGADMAEVPGGVSGLLARDYKGKNAAGW